MDGKMTVEFYNNPEGLTRIVVEGQDILETLSETGIEKMDEMVGILVFGKLMMLAGFDGDEEEDEDEDEDEEDDFWFSLGL